VVVMRSLWTSSPPSEWVDIRSGRRPVRSPGGAVIGGKGLPGGVGASARAPGLPICGSVGGRVIVPRVVTVPRVAPADFLHSVFR
jgi:hypothetical protein